MESDIITNLGGDRFKSKEHKFVIHVRFFVFKEHSAIISVYIFITGLSVAESVLVYCVVVARQCVRPSERSSASVSLSVFQERPHVPPRAASLVARWRGGEQCAVCVPVASTWLLTTRPVKVEMPLMCHCV